MQHNCNTGVCFMQRREINKTIRLNEVELYMVQQIQKIGGYNSISEAIRQAIRHYYSYLVRRYREGTLYRLKEVAERKLEDKEVQK